MVPPRDGKDDKREPADAPVRGFIPKAALTGAAVTALIGAADR